MNGDYFGYSGQMPSQIDIQMVLHVTQISERSKYSIMDTWGIVQIQHGAIMHCTEHTQMYMNLSNHAWRFMMSMDVGIQGQE